MMMDARNLDARLVEEVGVLGHHRRRAHIHLGGSWSGGYGHKGGEIYDSAADVWISLPRADVSRILTEDAAGAFRDDNHAWLFA
jgi:hypothetical protein